jgi:hypothetical protein
MNVRLAPSLEYYRLAGLYLLRTLGITTNHGEIRSVICDHAFFSQPTGSKGGRARRGEGVCRDLLTIAKGLIEADARRGQQEKINNIMRTGTTL